MSNLKKYRFSDKYHTAIITIPIMRKTITKHNATDEDIDFLLKKFPNKFDHNFELASEPKAQTIEAVVEEPQERKIRYPEGKPCMCKDWSVEHLKAYAKDHGINIGASQKKATIFKKIKEANEA